MRPAVSWRSTGSERHYTMTAVAPACVALLLISYGVAWCRCACSNSSLAGAQLDSLLAEYDRTVPPAPHVLATLGLDVRHASILESSSTVKLVADLHMSWQDSRITWNASEWGCDWALAAAERLWLPEVNLINAAAVADVDPLRARVSNTGAVSWAMRLDVTVPVSLQLADWPEDEQTAVFRFASRDLTEDQLSFTFKKDQAIMPYDSGAWEVVVANSSNTESLAVVDDGPSKEEAEFEFRAIAAWRLTLRRRSPAQAAAARVLVAAALLLLLGAALLPAASRAPLAATAAFTLALWLCGASWRAPGGAEAPRALRLCGGLCGAAGALAACAALVCRVARLTAPPPAALRRALAAASAVWVLSPPPAEGASGAGGSGAWAAAARLLDAVLLATLALVIVVLLCLYH